MNKRARQDVLPSHPAQLPPQPCATRVFGTTTVRQGRGRPPGISADARPIHARLAGSAFPRGTPWLASRPRFAACRFTMVSTLPRMARGLTWESSVAEIHVSPPFDPSRVPAESCQGLACRPVQLTFDGFIIGPAEGRRKPRAPGSRRCPGNRSGQAGRCCRTACGASWCPGAGHPDGDEHRPPQETSTSIFRRACRAVELRLRRWPDRLRLELRSDHESRVGTRFELELRTKPFLSLRVRRGGAWSSHSWVWRPG